MIKIVCFGKIKESYLNDLINDYLKRLSKYHKIEIINLDDINDLNKEAANLQKVLKNSDYNIVLDIHGKRYSSEKFSTHLIGLFNHYSTVTFIIGSSFGVHESVKNNANELISFSDFTLPHGLFRGVLLEQIYRAFKIDNNEAYHK